MLLDEVGGDGPAARPAPPTFINTRCDQTLGVCKPASGSWQFIVILTPRCFAGTSLGRKAQETHLGGTKAPSGGGF